MISLRLELRREQQRLQGPGSLEWKKRGNPSACFIKQFTTGIE